MNTSSYVTRKFSTSVDKSVTHCNKSNYAHIQCQPLPGYPQILGKRSLVRYRISSLISNEQAAYNVGFSYPHRQALPTEV